MGEAKRRKATAEASQQIAPPAPMTLGDAWRQCPFRSLLGTGVTAHSIPSLTVAVMGGDPEPISQGWMKEIVAILQDGGTVEVLSDRADLRDYAKREILAMATLPATNHPKN